MGSVGALGVGLSVVFGGFVVVLLAELYYMFFWRSQSIATSKRVDSVGAENEQRGSYVREAALVGSFGGYPGSPFQPEFVTKFFTIGGAPELLDQGRPPQNGAIPPSCGLLPPIKEETKEDMEFEELKSKSKAENRDLNRTPSGVLLAHFSGSSTPEETPFATPASSPSACWPVQFSPTSVKPASLASPPRGFKEPLACSSNSSADAFPDMPVFSPQSSPRITPFSTPPMQPLRSPLKALFDLSPILGPQEVSRILSPPPQPSSSVQEHTSGSLGRFSSSFVTSSRFALKTLLHQPSPPCRP